MSSSSDFTSSKQVWLCLLVGHEEGNYKVTEPHGVYDDLSLLLDELTAGIKKFNSEFVVYTMEMNTPMWEDDEIELKTLDDVRKFAHEAGH